MPNSLSNRIGFPELPRVRQRTDAHCGPAVVQMLARAVGRRLDQDRIVAASGAGKRLRRHGMVVEEMGKAVSVLMPDMVFWYKRNATFTDLEHLVNRYGVPVGVEWQGEFGKYSDGDNGHYSVVTYIDAVEGVIVLSDPFFVFAGHDRTFTIPEFMSRWWDVNTVAGRDGTERKRTDTHVLFTIAEPTRQYPRIIGMNRV